MPVGPKNDYFIKIYLRPLNEAITIIMNNVSKEDCENQLLGYMEESVGFDRINNWDIQKIKSDMSKKI